VAEAFQDKISKSGENFGTFRSLSRRFPVRNAKEVIRALRKHGFQQIDQSGSHQKWRNEDGRQVIVPFHGSKSIPIGTLKSILEGSGLRAEDL
jgi:predicted RNA binding protein YcfA (HicA-like mRNA interferase family)